MRFADRWNSLSLIAKNCIIVLAADLLLLASGALSVPGLKQVWAVLTGYMPDLYQPVFLQFIALLRDTSPSMVVASGTALTFTTLFLTLVSFHVLAAVCVGFLFQKFSKGLTWKIANYVVFIFVLFFFHLFLIAKSYWLYLL